MGIEDQYAKAFGGEVVGTESDNNNTVDLTTDQGQEEVQQQDQPATQEESNVVDLTTKESSLNTEETTAEEQPQASQPEESQGISDEQIFKHLSEKLGRELTSYDDLNTTSEETESNDFASEQLKVINEYVKNTGRTVQDYLNTQSVDLSNVSDDAIMKEYLRVDNPKLTEAELNDYIAATYKTDSKEYSTRDTNAGKVQLTKDAKAARDYFNQIKKDYAMPVEGNNPETSEAERGEWLSQMEETVNDLEGLSFSMNDKGDEFVYNLDDNARQEIKGHNSNLENFFDKYIDKGGEWDFDKLNTDMYILNNIDKIVRGVANQYKSKGTESVINEIKNPSFTQDKQEAPHKQRTTLDMLRNEIFGK